MGESVDGNVRDDGDEIVVGNLLRVHVNLFLLNVTSCSARFSKKRDSVVDVFTRNIFFGIWVMK